MKKEKDEKAAAKEEGAKDQVVGRGVVRSRALGGIRTKMVE